jgi:hypothetical protein
MRMGTLTSPKEIAPDQIARGMPSLFPLARARKRLLKSERRVADRSCE